jgi:hypothetical protein
MSAIADLKKLQPKTATVVDKVAENKWGNDRTVRLSRLSVFLVHFFVL